MNHFITRQIIEIIHFCTMGSFVYPLNKISIIISICFPSNLIEQTGYIVIGVTTCIGKE